MKQALQPAIAIAFCVTVLISLAAIQGCDNTTHMPAQAQSAYDSHSYRIYTDWPSDLALAAPNPQVEKRVTQILSEMTLEQKIAQMIQPEIRYFTVEDMRRYGFGSYLNGGSASPNNDKFAAPYEWVGLAEAMHQASIDDSLDASSIPTMWGTDAVHGHNNVFGATIFPHNVGLGAMKDPELVRSIAAATAAEVSATGIDWVFAPTVAVARNDRWGRVYESYSENPELVWAYSRAYVQGLQGETAQENINNGKSIATLKHYIGDGGTERGDDQGETASTERQLIQLHAAGYFSGLEAGAQTVMASFSSWQGKKLHGNRYLLTEVLKERLGFDGVVVGDWNGHGQISGCSKVSCPQAIMAGMDILMAPDSWKELYDNTLGQVHSGEITQARIDDAVRRILRVKIRSGLMDAPSPGNRALANNSDIIGARAHRNLASDAVKKSLVLLKNENNILPISGKQKIFVTGDGADNIGKQAGGWSLSWQGTGNKNSDFPNGTSILDGIRNKVMVSGGEIEFATNGNFSVRPDLAIVVFGEEPYAEGHGDIDDLEYQKNKKEDLTLLKKLRDKGIPVISIFLTGRPLWINPELNASNAFVVAWLPGSEGSAVADVLFTDAQGNVNNDFTGTLPFSWPSSPYQENLNIGDEQYSPLFPYGYGLSYEDIFNTATKYDELPNRHATTTDRKIYQIYNGGSGQDWQVSVRENNTTSNMESNVLSLARIKVETQDRMVQEDSLRVTWDNSMNSDLVLQSEDSVDLSQYFAEDAYLAFDFILHSGKDARMAIGAECVDACMGMVDIEASAYLSENNEWASLAISSKCFVQSGFKPQNTISPFLIRTHGSAEISIANIRLEMSQPKNSHIKLCQ